MCVQRSGLSEWCSIPEESRVYKLVTSGLMNVIAPPSTTDAEKTCAGENAKARALSHLMAAHHMVMQAHAKGVPYAASVKWFGAV